MDGRPNRRNKAPFSNFYGVEWTGAKILVVPKGTNFRVLQQLQAFW